MPDQPTQLAFPPRVVNGRLLEVDQGDADDLAGRVHLLCLTPQGYFPPPLADLGLYQQAHLAGGADVQEIERQIDKYVPDAEDAVSEDPSALGAGLEVLGVRVGAGS